MGAITTEDELLQALCAHRDRMILRLGNAAVPRRLVVTLRVPRGHVVSKDNDPSAYCVNSRDIAVVQMYSHGGDFGVLRQLLGIPVEYERTVATDGYRLFHIDE